MMNRCALSAHYEVLGDYVMKEFITSHPELFRHILCIIIILAGLVHIIKLEIKNSKYRKTIINGLNNDLSNYQIKYDPFPKNNLKDYQTQNNPLPEINLNDRQVQNNSVSDSDAYTNLLKEKNLLEQKFNYYQRKVKLNLNNLFTVGELTLIEIFRDMLSREEFSDWCVYGQVQPKKTGEYRIDFLVVSKKGVFVVESKAWKGLTLIYEPNYSNALSYSIYENYGRRIDSRSTEIQVFNINSSGINDSLYINKYTNPIEQARDYSRSLRNLLNFHIKNLVVFQQDEDYQVKFNENDFNRIDIDDYTTVICNRGVISYFSMVASEHINADEVNTVIRNNYDYAICLNASNVNEPPWNIN